MTRRAGNRALAISLPSFLFASLLGWRLVVRRAAQPPLEASALNSPSVPPGRWPFSKLSRIIDLPAVLVRRRPVSAPKEPGRSPKAGGEKARASRDWPDSGLVGLCEARHRRQAGV